MDQLIEISTASWSTWLLVSARFFGAMLVMPLFSENTIPLRFKFGFAFLLALIVAPMDLSGQSASLAFSDPASAIIGLGGELALGWVLGCALALVIWGAHLGAAWLGAFTGDAAFSTGQQEETGESPLTTLLTLFATLAFIGLDGHRLVMLMLIDSFQKVPAGVFASVMSGNMTELGEEAASAAGAVGQQTWLIGLEIAFPAVAVLLLITLVLGILSRVTPQIDVFFTGFALRTSVGFAMIFLCLPFIAEVFSFVVERSLQGTGAVLDRLAGG